MIKALHTLGWLAVIAIAALSLIPGNFRPHVATSNYVEHFVAYFVVAMLLTFGNNKRAYFVTIPSLLMLSAGILEIAQLWVPGRNSAIADFAASSLGIWCGAFATSLSSKWILSLRPTE